MFIFRWSLSELVFLFILNLVSRSAEQTTNVSRCHFPEYFRGDFFSVDNRDELNTKIVLDSMSNEVIGTEYCFEYSIISDSTDALGRSDIRVLLYNPTARCYQCYELYHRTLNILQYRHSECLTEADGTVPTLDVVCSFIKPNTDLDTMFRTEVQTVNCKHTIQGCYHFTYEVEFGGGGICDSPQSVINACQQPGSVYVDNQVFEMQFGVCPEVTSSVDHNIRFQCMGTWQDSTGNIYSAMSNIGAVKSRDRFRCMLTRTDQEISDNSLRYTMSRWASCKVLKTPYDGDIRLILSPTIYNAIPYIEPGCNFPQNFSGTYYMGGDYDNDITINSTHIYKYVHLTQYQYLETYFICLQHADNRYLVFTIDVGKCESHYVCYDFIPRHHSILRWRLAKPLATDLTKLGQPEYMQRIFRRACAWSAFTVDRDQTSFKYNYFMLNPPQPVPCPIGGRYSFTQYGRPEEFYRTRIRGITERPRHSIDCMQYTSVLKSCDANPSKMTIDAEYCATLDHTGKPISEYDQPDREMVCAGYWMEDMTSYLVTYDREDPFSNFRCWVYQRTGWRDIQMSRSSQAYCGPTQTAVTDQPEDGGALRFVMKESERLWDSCAQRYSSGENPFEHLIEVHVLDTAVSIRTQTISISVMLTFYTTFFLNII